MHERLRGYYRPSANEFGTLWREATFFLDTSVLLNLYRYPHQAKDDLFRVLERLGNRIVVPFHSALEYERNRLNVVADQKKRFRDVRETVTSGVRGLRNSLDGLQLKKRHSSINADDFIDKLQHAETEFLTSLEDLERSQPTVNELDQTRERIRSLIGSRVGDPPASQAELDSIYALGATRYSLETPPGFLDIGKKDETFEYGGLVYLRKFGDLIIWEQLIRYCVSSGITSAVLVTDDDKEDWWWIVDSQGQKRIGPRPELVEEIHRRASVGLFYIYNSEQLVRWSSDYLDVDVKSASAGQIRDVKQVDSLTASFYRKYVNIERAVSNWLQEQHPDSVIETSQRFPDFVVVTDQGRRIGFEVAAFGPRHALLMRLIDKLSRLQGEIDGGSLDEAWLVSVAAEPSEVLRILRRGETELPRITASGVGVLVGSLIKDENNTSRFVLVQVVEPRASSVET